jgi:hypothetical protein
MQDASKDVTARRDYSLFVRRNPGELALKLSDEGVAIAGGCLLWVTEAGEDSRPLADVSAVHLSVAHIARHGDFGSCIIHFGGAAPLQVVGSSAFGFPDEERDPAYAAFVRDLHEQLATRPTGAVRFSAGVSEGRLQVMQVMLVIAGLFFVALPLVLLLLIGELIMLAAATAGGLFVTGIYASMQKNRPRGYDPCHIPAELLP